MYRKLISVLTLNLRIESYLDGIHAFSHRKEGLIRCLLSQQADTMGFQEMTEPMMASFAAGMTGYRLIGERNKNTGKAEYNAIAYREDTLCLLRTGTFWLSKTPEVPGSRFLLQSPDPRTCTWAEFQHLPSGRKFRYFNTHLDHLSPIARAQGLRVLFDKMSAFQAENPLPFFLGGDFNFTPQSKLYKLCCDKRIGAQTMTDLSEPLPTTFHWFGKLKRPFKLDYMFTNVHTKDEVFTTQTLRYNDEGGYLSDHDAVRMDWAL